MHENKEAHDVVQVDIAGGEDSDTRSVISGLKKLYLKQQGRTAVYKDL